MLGQLLEIIGASLSEQLWLFLSQRCHFIRNLSLLRSKLLASPNSINCYIVLPSIFRFFQDFKVFFSPPRFSKILKQVLQCYPISRVSHQTQVLMVSSEARNIIKLQNDHQKKDQQTWVIISTVTPEARQDWCSLHSLKSVPHGQPETGSWVSLLVLICLFVMGTCCF